MQFKSKDLFMYSITLSLPPQCLYTTILSSASLSSSLICLPILFPCLPTHPLPLSPVSSHISHHYILLLSLQNKYKYLVFNMILTDYEYIMQIWRFSPNLSKFHISRGGSTLSKHEKHENHDIYGCQGGWCGGVDFLLWQEWSPIQCNQTLL